jgi:hypothetical protein
MPKLGIFMMTVAVVVWFTFAGTFLYILWLGIKALQKYIGG